MIRSIAASLLIATAAHAELPEQLYAPMNTKMTRVSAREHFCDCVIYSVGQYRVAEIGSVRLAVKTDKPLDDKPTVVNLPLKTMRSRVAVMWVTTSVTRQTEMSCIARWEDFASGS